MYELSLWELVKGKLLIEIQEKNLLVQFGNSYGINFKKAAYSFEVPLLCFFFFFFFFFANFFMTEAGIIQKTVHWFAKQIKEDQRLGKKVLPPQYKEKLISSA